MSASSLSHVQSGSLSSCHSLFSSFRQLTDAEYLRCAKLLQHLTANCGSSSPRASTSFLNASRDEYTDDAEHGASLPTHLINFVFAVVKYMAALDQMLLDTDFLVQNHDLIPSLSLVKVMLFQYLSSSFDPTQLLLDGDSGSPHPPILAATAAALTASRTKLHAAYARIRIAKHAVGTSDDERLGNLVDWSAEQLVESAPVAFRLRHGLSLEQLSNELAWPEDAAENDPHFPDVVLVPPCYVPDVLEARAFAQGKVVLQDRASMVPIQVVLERCHGPVDRAWTVLETRASVANRLLMWADLTPHRVVVASGAGGEREDVQGLNVDAHDRIELAPTAFLDLAPGSIDCDGGYAPDLVVVEPANSLSAVLDEKYFMLQEALIKPREEYAAAINKLGERQRRELINAMKFPTARYIVYVTRSVHAEENESVVNACLEAQADWRVVPLDDDEEDDEQEDHEPGLDERDHAQSHAIASRHVTSRPGSPPAEISPYLSIHPDPPRVTNGLFVALLERRSLSTTTNTDAVGDDHECEETESIEPTESADPSTDSTPSPPPRRTSAKKKKKKVPLWRRQPVWRGAGTRAPWQPLPALAADSTAVPAGLVVEGMSVATPAATVESDGATLKLVHGSTTSLNGGVVGKKRPAFPVPNPRPWK
ncbi:putative 28S rRNA (cytosine-C(5))-methyltransferase [Allomyces arbusculus]|nr:putative 28S rRNA (cytosine-C(5))-methyltransferase [Allomyces arbusculus]